MDHGLSFHSVRLQAATFALLTATKNKTEDRSMLLSAAKCSTKKFLGPEMGCFYSSTCPPSLLCLRMDCDSSRILARTELLVNFGGPQSRRDNVSDAGNFGA